MAEDSSADQLSVPEWLNEQFVTDVLKSHEKEPDLKVTKLDYTPGSAKGDNYASDIIRARVEYTTHKGSFSKSLIIKTVLEMFAGSALFKTEIGMYSKVLPKFSRILRENNDTSRLYAECIYYSLEPHQVMIFEDLGELDYAMVRNRMLTHEEICGAYSKLAKFHALSMKIINERPEFVKEFKDGICLVDIPYMSSGMGPFKDFLGRIPGLERYKPHFKKIEVHFIDRLRDIMKEYQTNPQPGYYVLCHGDYHTRNIMVKHNKESGGFEDCMLLDYQGCYVAPLAVDLMYSIYMLMSREQRIGELEILLNYYFSVLRETLRRIGYQGELPDPLAFWKEMNRLKDYGLSLTSAANEETDDKLQDFIEECKSILARFERSGYFENL
ncbi:GD21211 [Drosophila simulans]|uniref:GD21211 n=1 Tax=Drosophila simulans TaxID=7240 RepID=B4QUU2_DROSI|nr:GD21211 [Drosophila simulans]